MYIEERQQKILEIINKKKRVDVKSLSIELKISQETVRRDLRRLERDGFLKRTHGGAIVDSEIPKDAERPTTFRQGINLEKKGMVAKRAASFIEMEDTILLDNSTTAFHILRYIPQSYRITILTNALPILIEANKMSIPNWTCICLGGVLREKSYSLVGYLAMNTLSFFRPDKLFMSCAGIDDEGILTEGNINEVQVKREFIKCSKERFLLLDDSKLGTISAVNEGSLSDFDFLITNSSADKSFIKKLGQLRVEIIFDM